MLSKLVERGTLTVVWPSGARTCYGEGNPQATLKLHGRWTPWDLALRPGLSFGEAYMDERLTIEVGSIDDVLEILIKNVGEKGLPSGGGAARFLSGLLDRIGQFNSLRRSRRNVAHHYDLSRELYELFLDADRQYTCAYYEKPEFSLEEAQLAKKDYVAAKLRLTDSNLKTLDLGCGWGGLALHFARNYGADALGINLSKEQVKVANERAQSAGLEDRCRFERKDYRDVQGVFDRISSIGMLEHVGRSHYDVLFKKIYDLLAPDGVALMHTIGRTDGPGLSNAWQSKYIFPGGYSPALSEILPAIERSGLYITDIEILRLHYAKTVKEWLARFKKNRAQAAELYDERFCRMWEFYLAGAEMNLRYDHLVNFQIQLTRKIDAVPITRHYMANG